VTLFAEEAVRFLQEELCAVWKDLDPEDREGAEATVRDTTELLVRQLQGDDVEDELEEVAAQLKLWTFAGSSHVRRAVSRALKRWAVLVGRFLLGVAEGAFRGLIENDGAVDELLRGLQEE